MDVAAYTFIRPARAGTAAPSAANEDGRIAAHRPSGAYAIGGSFLRHLARGCARHACVAVARGRSRLFCTHPGPSPAPSRGRECHPGRLPSRLPRGIPHRCIRATQLGKFGDFPIEFFDRICFYMTGYAPPTISEQKTATLKIHPKSPLHHLLLTPLKLPDETSHTFTDTT